MAKEETAFKPSGLTFSGALTIAFIVLKLTGHIGWSWVWVLSPIWIAVALVFLLASIVVLLKQ